MDNIKGSIQIAIKDSDSGKIKKIIQQDNAITSPMFLGSIMGTPSSSNHWEFVSTSAVVPFGLCISSRIVHEDVKTVSAKAQGFFSSEYPNDAALYPVSSDFFIDYQDEAVQEWTVREGNPTFVEYIGRFNSPTDVRTINSVYAAPRNSIISAATIVKLTTPCIQNVGEVLDITYRIQFFNQNFSESDVFNISPFFTDLALIPSLLRSTTRDTNVVAFPVFSNARFNGVPENDNIIQTFPQENSELPDDNRYINRLSHYKSEYNFDFTENDLNGEIIRSVGYGSAYSTTIRPPLNDFPDATLSQMIWANFTSDEFQFKPVQPIQGHSVNAIEWGLDVDFLPTSQGQFNVDGSNWIQDNWPELWRIDYTTTGEIGNARYVLRKRPLLGFNGITYEPKQIRLGDFWTDALLPNITTTIGAHGIRDTLRKEEYGPDSLIKWDGLGISLLFINSPNIFNYDSTSTPPLPVQSVRQVAVDDSMNIWVACRNTGLYKISNPTDPTAVSIEKITGANNSIAVAGQNNCYGVAVGYDNSIWAIFEGALTQTTNPTDDIPTFTNYTPTSAHPFSFSPLTDSNWSAIKYIKVDRDSSDNQLAIIYSSGNRDQILWWSQTEIAVIGPLGNSIVSTSIPASDGDQYGYVGVSQKGSFWAWKNTIFSPDPFRLQWGTTSSINIDQANSRQDSLSSINYMYDYYGTPYLFCHSTVRTATNSTENGLSIISPEGITYTVSAEGSSTIPLTTIHSWENQLGSSVFMSTANSSFGSDLANFNTRIPFNLNQMTPRNELGNDSLNGRYSPFEELMWQRFHWNGIDWEQNFYQNAEDTGTSQLGTFPASRNNFNADEHYFTGRSMLDVTNSFSSGNFSSQATFAFSIQANPKLIVNTTFPTNGLKSQERERTIFDFSTSDRQLKLLWDNDLNGDMAIVDNGTASTITETPPNRTTGFDRLVVTIDSNQVVIYLNGVQVGQLTSPNGAFDFSNSGDELLAFIGSRVYLWENSQRNSPWQSEFFRGYMQNIQLWNSAWTETDVANDFADIDGIITSQSADNLISRFNLTEDVFDSRVIHSNTENLIDGVTINFENGASPDSFVAGDYYTFGMVDGILKDNSLTFNQQFSLYWKPSNFNFSDITNTTGGSVIENVSNFNTTESAIFEHAESVQMDTNRNASPTSALVMVLPSQIGNNQSSSWGYRSTAQSGSNINQVITSDGFLEGMNGFDDNSGIFGLISDPTSEIRTNSSILNSMNYAFSFNPNGTVDILESGTIVSAGIDNFTVDDIYRIRRVGTSVIYEKTDSLGATTVLFNSPTASTGNLYGRAILNNAGQAFCRMNINFDRPANIMVFGDSSTGTGIYNPEFIRMETLNTNTIDIKIDGVQAQVTISDGLTDRMITPPPGEVTINGQSGYALFNDADVGKTVTANVTMIFDKV